jgi:polar amino acid transport system substrate-binding protein
MRKALLLLPVALVLALAAAACGSDDDEGSAAGTTTTTEQASCDKGSLETVNPGQLTIGTDNPAFPPWFEGKGEFEPWDPTTPPTKKGYEAETAYAVAHELGYTDDEIKWTVVPFDQLFKPGRTSYDIDANQASYLPARAKNVDFSDSYYDVEQALVAFEANPISKATSVADLKTYKLGAQLGTTSLNTINDTIQPDKEASVFSTNNDALSGLKAKQVDGIVVDFPTALYMSAVQLKGGTVVGRFPADGKEYFGLVLAKDSPLTSCVNEALARVKDAGTLDKLQQKWLGGSAPILQ